MRILVPALTAFLCGCVATPRAARESEAPRAPEPPLALPDRIVLPAAYRLVLLDGHLTLVRESDASALEGAPTSLRIVSGEISHGELAYQPGLLPQELAGEVASERARSDRLDAALESVMQRSRELSEEAVKIQAEARRLADLLARQKAGAEPAPGARTEPDPASSEPNPNTPSTHALPE